MKSGSIAVVVAALLVALASPVLSQIDTTTIYQIQMGNIPEGTTVFVDSVIVTAIDLKPNTYGFMAQERGGGPYSGILCYMSYERPDTVGGTGLSLGDLISVQGEYSEYYGVSEIDYIDKVRILQEGYGEPEPQLMSIADLGHWAQDSTYAEQWEGVFLMVDTVVVTEHGEFDEWSLVEAHVHPGAGPGDTCLVDDKLVDPTLPKPGVGDTLVSVRGVYSFEYGTYKIWARGDSDIVYLGLPPGPNVVIAYPTSNTKIDVTFDRGLDETSAENTDNYALLSGTDITTAALDNNNAALVHLTTAAQPASQLEVLTACDVESGLLVPMDSCQTYSFRAGLTPITFVQTPGVEDSSQCVGDQVTITGIVSSPDSSYDGSYFMQDRGGGPWSGIYIFEFVEKYNVGDSVIVSGLVNEHYNMTELVSIDYSARVGVGKPIQVTVVTPDTIKTGSPNAEPYEGVLVRMDTVEVFTPRDGYGEWFAGIGTDSVKIGDFAEYTYPGLGSTINITGCVRFEYSEFKIEPRNDADIVTVTACPAGIDEKGLTLRLDQNSPNPFASETTIRFTVPREMRVRLAVYDISGRLIQVVADETASVGERVVRWDGRDSRGERVSPGVYFCRFVTPEDTIQKKMVFIR